MNMGFFDIFGSGAVDQDQENNGVKIPEEFLSGSKILDGNREIIAIKLILRIKK